MSAPPTAAARYRAAISNGLRWMLSRPALGAGWLNTKQDSFSLRDYDASDGVRGPGFVYGWIQGRGLEALATHAAALQGRDDTLAAACDQAGQRLYRLLAETVAAEGHAYFLYDAGMHPVRLEGETPVPQTRAAEIFTCSDVFAAKGLLAAAHRYAPADLPNHLAWLARIVEAVETGRFQMDESAPLSTASIANEKENFAPRMILLGACALLRRIGQAQAADFGERFLAHVLKEHLHAESGLLRETRQEDICNPGHAAELVAFALDAGLREGREELLTRLLLAHAKAGLVGPGMALRLTASTGAVLDARCPWWSLPETIRAAALLHRATANPAALRLWERADNAFFRQYWRPHAGLAYQVLDAEGPVDFVPATPDLDPGYHTGLSLLRAAEVAEETGKETDNGRG